MKLIYNGMDITDQTMITGAEYIDNAGGRADRLEIGLNDPGGMWPNWKPQRGDTIRMIEGALDTGAFFVDRIQYARETAEIGAVSVPPAASNVVHRAWEQIRFHEIVDDVAENIGVAVHRYGVPNHLYNRIAQQSQTVAEWLFVRCMLEECSLKFYDGAMKIFGIEYMESRNVIATIDLSNVDWRYESHAVGLCASCRLESASSATYSLPGREGPQLRVPGPTMLAVPAYSVGEAERYAKSILLYNNRLGESATILSTLLPDVIAGSMIGMVNGPIPMLGEWFVERANHIPIKNQTALLLRRRMGVPQ